MKHIKKLFSVIISFFLPLCLQISITAVVTLDDKKIENANIAILNKTNQTFFYGIGFKNNQSILVDPLQRESLRSLSPTGEDKEVYSYDNRVNEYGVLLYFVESSTKKEAKAYLYEIENPKPGKKIYVRMVTKKNKLVLEPQTKLGFTIKNNVVQSDIHEKEINAEQTALRKYITEKYKDNKDEKKRLSKEQLPVVSMQKDLPEVKPESKSYALYYLMFESIQNLKKKGILKQSQLESKPSLEDIDFPFASDLLDYNHNPKALNNARSIVEKKALDLRAKFAQNKNIQEEDRKMLDDIIDQARAKLIEVLDDFYVRAYKKIDGVEKALKNGDISEKDLHADPISFDEKMARAVLGFSPDESLEKATIKKRAQDITHQWQQDDSDMTNNGQLAKQLIIDAINQAKLILEKE